MKTDREEMIGVMDEVAAARVEARAVFQLGLHTPVGVEGFAVLEGRLAAALAGVRRLQARAAETGGELSGFGREQAGQGGKGIEGRAA